MQPIAYEYAGFTPDRGDIDEITPADPAAGANLTIDLGRQEWIVVDSLTFTLNTDANVANRFVAVDILARGGLAVMRNAATVLVTASTVNQVFQFDTQHTVSEWNTGTPVYAPFQPVPLPMGWQLRVTIDAIQVGDAITSCRVLCRRFYRASLTGSAADDGC
jgi:hypothetical protein